MEDKKEKRSAHPPQQLYDPSGEHESVKPTDINTPLFEAERNGQQHTFLRSIVVIVLTLMTLGLFLGGGAYFVLKAGENNKTNNINNSQTPDPTPAPTPNSVVCAQDARLCPDGSYVSRQGPNCDFAPCPGETYFCGGIANIKCPPGLVCELDNDLPDSQGACIEEATN